MWSEYGQLQRMLDGSAVQTKISFVMDDASELLTGTQGMKAILNADIIAPEATDRLSGLDR